MAQLHRLWYPVTVSILAAATHECCGPYTKAMQVPKPPVEITNPEAAAAAIDAATEPFASIRKAAEIAGLPKTTTQRLIERLKMRYEPLYAELTKVKTEEIIALLDDRLHRALLYLDDLAMGGASAKDLAVITGIMAEKSQLLKGKATAILTTNEDRMNRDELHKELIKEGIRRGLITNAVWEEVIAESKVPDVLPLPSNGSAA